MQIKNGEIQPFATKRERIAELEARMAEIETAPTLEAAQAIARACRRTDKRWRGNPANSMTYAALKLAEQQERERAGAQLIGRASNRAKNSISEDV